MFMYYILLKIRGSMLGLAVICGDGIMNMKLGGSIDDGKKAFVTDLL